jgi:hypothetical protein
MKAYLVIILFSIISLCELLIAHPIVGYIGPGTGLSAIGTVLAAIAGIIVAIFGFLWYPIKRLLRKRKSRINTKRPEDMND